MNWKRTIAAALTFGVAAAGAATAAWAQEPEQAARPAGAAKGHVEQRAARKPQVGVWAEIRAIDQVNHRLLAQIRERFGPGGSEQRSQRDALRRPQRKPALPPEIQQEMNALRRKVAAAEKARDRAALEGLRAEMEALQARVAAAREEMKAEAEKLRAEAEASKAELDELKVTMEPIRALLEQERTIMEAIRPLHEQIRAASVELRQAREAGDIAAATAALSQIMETEEQVTAKGQQLLAVKQQINAALTEIAGR